MYIEKNLFPKKVLIGHVGIFYDVKHTKLLNIYIYNYLFIYFFIYYIQLKIYHDSFKSNFWCSL